MKDYSKVKPVPPTFSFESVDQANCPKDSKFKIISKLNPEKTIAVKLIFPLTYPEGISLIYNFESDELLCFGFKEVNDIIIMEQNIISKGAKKLFFLNNFSSDLQCQNRLLEPAKNKIEVDVSFRQVSHIKKIGNKISFFFADFVNSVLSANYNILMNIILAIVENQVKK